MHKMSDRAIENGIYMEVINMTLEEASANWKISDKTICKWICEGLINNLSLKDNKLILPDIKNLI